MSSIVVSSIVMSPPSEHTHRTYAPVAPASEKALEKQPIRIEVP